MAPGAHLAYAKDRKLRNRSKTFRPPRRPLDEIGEEVLPQLRADQESPNRREAVKS